ncbi:transposase [Streptomyces collinus]|uniref:transposase n=1 Tax=Streptomyces collinus TaxID=42684 RepID=UPI0036CD80DB
MRRQRQRAAGRSRADDEWARLASAQLAGVHATVAQLANGFPKALPMPSTARRRRYPSDTTAREWALIGPLLPLPARQAGGRPGKWHRRDIVDAIRYLVDNGVKRLALPGDSPPWQTVFYQFAAWQRRGLIAFSHDQLRPQIRTS